VTLQAILNCAQASFDHFKLNCDAWSLVRTYFRGLLGSEDLERYREIYDERNDDKNRQSKWADLLENDQLKAFSLYLKDKPAELAAYHKFLVSIFSFVHAYFNVVVIISHHRSAGALQS